MTEPRRRFVLDEAKRREIVAILSVGCSQRVAARYVQCSESTIRRTARRDAAFAAEIRRARMNSEVRMLKCVRRAARKDQYWRAAAWVLERVFPQRYARRGPDVITVEQIGHLMAQFAEIIDHDIPPKYHKRVLDRLRAISGHTLEAAKGLKDEKGSHNRPKNLAGEKKRKEDTDHVPQPAR